MSTEGSGSDYGNDGHSHNPVDAAEHGSGQYYGSQGSKHYDDGYYQSNYRGSNYRGRGSRGSTYRGRGGYQGDYYSGRGGYQGRFNNSSYYSSGGARGGYSSTYEREPYSGDAPQEEKYHEDSTSSYRGSSYRGNNYRGNYRGRGNYYNLNYQGNNYNSSYDSGYFQDKSAAAPATSPRHSVSRENSSKKVLTSKYTNPWIETLGISSESVKETLESRYKDLEKSNKELLDFQRSKLKLKNSYVTLENLATKEGIHVQLANEKLEEFTYL